MLRLTEIKLPLGHAENALPDAILQTLDITPAEMARFAVFKRSFDARKAVIMQVYIVDVTLASAALEAQLLATHAGNPHIFATPDMAYHPVGSAPANLPLRPVVVGFGPCGMFAALVLAQMGFKPIVLERGKTVRERTKDTWGLWRKGELNPDSNVQFGEGGAGTFSDGKLWSQITDPRHLTRKVLTEFVKAGAPDEILYVSKPHIGTFRLVGMIEKMRAEIEALGGEAIANTDSVATPEGGEAIVASAVEAFGTVDIVINNAGILRDKTFHNMTPELIDAVIDVHLRGAFYTTLPAYKIMREKNYGRIVNTTSNSGLLGNFGQSNYGAAKLGLVGFTRVLANEGAKRNIKVNAIAPVAKTRMTEELFGAAGDLMAPEAISPTVAWLAHEDVPVSGEVFSVAGGYVARYFIGLTEGWFSPGHTVEDVRDNFEAIRDDSNYDIFADPSGELMKLMGLLSPSED